MEGLQNHLGVPVAVEGVAELLQLGPELGRVVQLAVVDDGEIFVGHGLPAALRVHHHQPAVEQRTALVIVGARLVRPARRERLRHGGEIGLMARQHLIAGKHSGNSTHRKKFPLLQV